MAKKETAKETEIKEETKEVPKDDTVEIPVGKYMSKARNNPWVVSTFVLGIILIAVLIFNVGVGKSVTGNVVSEDTLGKDLISFVEARTGETPTVNSVEKQENFYKVTLGLQGQQVPVFMTLDGKYLIPGQPISLTEQIPASDNSNTETPAPTNVPKTDKPKVEAFIFSYCPYGLQFEKALIPVYNLLKAKADINIVAIGAMHGEYEKKESLRQLCVQKEYGKDKLFSYLEKFDTDTAIGNCGGDDACLTPLVQKIYTPLGISKSKIESCMQKDAEALYTADTARASSLSVSGSPTFVINGVQVQVGRNADAIKTAICNAFNTAPSECSQALSTTSTSAGFGAAASSSGSSAATCAV